MSESLRDIAVHLETHDEWNAVRQAAGKPTSLEPLTGVADWS
jgi:hypothetical protein